MKRVVGYLIFSILVLLTASYTSYADPGPAGAKSGDFENQRAFAPRPPMMEPMKGTPGMPPCFMPFLPPCLNLDEKQKDAVRSIENKTQKELIRKRADEQIAEIELHELLDRDKVDINAVEAKLRQLSTIRADMQMTMIKAMESIKAELSPEQKKTLKRAPKMYCSRKPSVKDTPVRDGEQPALPPPAKKECPAR